MPVRAAQAKELGAFGVFGGWIVTGHNGTQLVSRVADRSPAEAHWRKQFISTYGCLAKALRNVLAFLRLPSGSELNHWRCKGL
jgi:hypothetical protein